MNRNFLLGCVNWLYLQILAALQFKTFFDLHLGQNRKKLVFWAHSHLRFPCRCVNVHTFKYVAFGQPIYYQRATNGKKHESLFFEKAVHYNPWYMHCVLQCIGLYCTTCQGIIHNKMAPHIEQVQWHMLQRVMPQPRISPLVGTGNYGFFSPMVTQK